MTKSYIGSKTDEVITKARITFECSVSECHCGCGHLQFKDKETLYTLKTKLLLSEDEEKLEIIEERYEPEPTWKCPQHPEAEPILLVTDIFT